MSRERTAVIATLQRPNGGGLRVSLRSGVRPDGFPWCKVRLHAIRIDGLLGTSIDLRPYEVRALAALIPRTSVGTLERYAEELAEADEHDPEQASHAAQDRSAASPSTSRTSSGTDAAEALTAGEREGE